MSDELIVMHCSPTLAGMKTGSVFTCEHNGKKELTESFRRINKRLVCKGLRAIPLRVSEKKALIYFYRPRLLKRDLSQKQAREILTEQGYCCEAPGKIIPEKCIIKLIERLKSSSEFPHEIGLFLGYPAEDVKGFIENKAACSKCVGCWKVYGDVGSAQRIFAKYGKCTRIYCECLKSGSTVEKLTVPVLG